MTVFCALPAKASPSKPNIVFILADDMGYGDVAALNKDSKIPTPNMDRLANEGMIFTDAHSGSAVCTPTRYGILTGRYCWRTRMKSGVLGGYSKPLIPVDRMTVASLLKAQGYNTACFGKWHLGWEWQLSRDNANPENWDQEFGAVDYSKSIEHGPTTRGFDHFFGIPASLDMAPYVYVENDRVTAVPDTEIKGSGGKRFWRKGPIAPDFKHIEVMATLTEKAGRYIDAQSTDKPFFVYFPLTAPHKPILPSKQFQGKSGMNEWGDFVMEVDWTVGQVMDALRRNCLKNNTLIIVTSDNGATPGADFAELAQFGHDPSYIFRGHTADIFEGGHRIPFIARWPGRVKPGSSSNETICLTDLIATVAGIVGATLPDDAGEDSVSILPALDGKRLSEPLREATVHHSIQGAFSIRQGKWKLELCRGSGGWSNPKPGAENAKGLPPVQLYDLSADIAETTNLQDKYPEVVESMTALLQQYVARGRSTPGEAQENEGNASIFR
ncbi:MAG: arylsulfatase [Candidatus Hydrogenedentes bacterium]|nr:arylsulfatase [Candidatus Hydrogenedentota bacterium]